MNTCVWVLATNKPCGEKTGYTMVPDGGEPGADLVRKYKSFCPPHMERAMTLREDEDSD